MPAGRSRRHVWLALPCPRTRNRPLASREKGSLGELSAEPTAVSVSAVGPEAGPRRSPLPSDQPFLLAKVPVRGLKLSTAQALVQSAVVGLIQRLPSSS